MKRAVLALSCLAACATPAPDPRPGPAMARVPALGLAAIDVDAEGRCWASDTEPAVIETVTVQEVAEPAGLGPGGEPAPASYRSHVRHVIEREREAVAFETLCPPAYSDEFVASLQRALAARGFFAGEADGILDVALGRAVQDFQRIEGPDSPLLGLAAARDLGLVPLSPEQLASM